jgi:predicted AlkP superfamily pyrophosphatase or phosphodiesterase
MATFLVLLDAFRHDYLEERVTPFLWRCARRGRHYQCVVPSLGFCERTEMLSGLRPDASGFFTAVGFDPDHSPFRGIGGLKIPRLLEKATVSRWPRGHELLRRGANRFFRGRGIAMPAFRIPFALLPSFALTEDRLDHRLPGAFPVPSVLDLLRQNNRKYYYDSFTAIGFRSPLVSDRDRLNAVRRESGSDYDLFLVYVSALDSAGHEFGPESSGLRAVLSGLDRDLAEFVNGIELPGSRNQYIFVGDHGMLPVARTVPVEQALLTELGRAGFRVRRDFLFFLDSTIVRVWVVNEKARAAIAGVMASAPAFRDHGRMLDAASASKFHTPLGDRRYGDYIWLADPGTLVFPDFFHRLTPSKGMHGYDPALPESQGMCIHFGHGIQPEVHASIPLAGINGILRESLRL